MEQNSKIGFKKLSLFFFFIFSKKREKIRKVHNKLYTIRIIRYMENKSIF